MATKETMIQLIKENNKEIFSKVDEKISAATAKTDKKLTEVEERLKVLNVYDKKISALEKSTNSLHQKVETEMEKSAKKVKDMLAENTKEINESIKQHISETSETLFTKNRKMRNGMKDLMHDTANKMHDWMQDVRDDYQFQQEQNREAYEEQMKLVMSTIKENSAKGKIKEEESDSEDEMLTSPPFIKRERTMRTLEFSPNALAFNKEEEDSDEDDEKAQQITQEEEEEQIDNDEEYEEECEGEEEDSVQIEEETNNGAMELDEFIANFDGTKGPAHTISDRSQNISSSSSSAQENDEDETYSSEEEEKEPEVKVVVVPDPPKKAKKGNKSPGRKVVAKKNTITKSPARKASKASTPKTPRKVALSSIRSPIVTRQTTGRLPPLNSVADTKEEAKTVVKKKRQMKLSLPVVSKGHEVNSHNVKVTKVTITPVKRSVRKARK